MAVLLVAAHLLLGDPSAALEAECSARRKAGDEPADVADVCRRAFEAAPGGPGDRRTQLLATAHGLYQKALRARPNPVLACADARMLRSYAAQLAALPEGDRPGDREDVRTALEQVDPALVVDCTALENPTPPAPSPPAPSPPATSPPRSVDKAPIDQPRRGDKPRRRLRLAGGTLVGLGLGSAVAMVGALVRGADLRARAESVHDMYSGQMTVPADVDKEYNDSIARGMRANQLAIAFGVSAAALAGTGAALLIVDKRGKTNRVALSPLAVSTPGVRISVEF